jgi:hypothetical protein
MSDIIGTASVTLLRENEDGSADYQFNFPPEALDALTRLGILTAIQAGIEDAKHLNPEEEASLETNPYKREDVDKLIEHYEYALSEAAHFGVTGDVYFNWDEARKIAEKANEQ